MEAIEPWALDAGRARIRVLLRQPAWRYVADCAVTSAGLSPEGGPSVTQALTTVVNQMAILAVMVAVRMHVWSGQCPTTTRQILPKSFQNFARASCRHAEGDGTVGVGTAQSDVISVPDGAAKLRRIQRGPEFYLGPDVGLQLTQVVARCGGIIVCPLCMRH